MTRIQDMDHPAKLGPACEIALHQLPPRLLQRPGDLGVPVAGQVHEEEAVVDLVEVDGPGAPGGAAGAGQVAAAQQPVDQGGLSDVGAPGEGDLGAPAAGELFGTARADEEARSLDTHDSTE